MPEENASPVKTSASYPAERTALRVSSTFTNTEPSRSKKCNVTQESSCHLQPRDIPSDAQSGSHEWKTGRNGCTPKRSCSLLKSAKPSLWTADTELPYNSQGPYNAQGGSEQADLDSPMSQSPAVRSSDGCSSSKVICSSPRSWPCGHHKSFTAPRSQDRACLGPCVSPDTVPLPSCSLNSSRVVQESADQTEPAKSLPAESSWSRGSPKKQIARDCSSLMPCKASSSSRSLLKTSSTIKSHAMAAGKPISVTVQGPESATLKRASVDHLTCPLLLASPETSAAVLEDGGDWTTVAVSRRVRQRCSGNDVGFPQGNSSTLGNEAGTFHLEYALSGTSTGRSSVRSVSTAQNLPPLKDELIDGLLTGSLSKTPQKQLPKHSDCRRHSEHGGNALFNEAGIDHSCLAMATGGEQLFHILILMRSKHTLCNDLAILIKS